MPGNHSLVVGGRRFWAISFDHRQVFVDANDVVALPPGRERAAARGLA